MSTGQKAEQPAHLPWALNNYPPQVRLIFLEAELKATKELLEMELHGRRQDAKTIAQQRQTIADMQAKKNKDPLTGLFNAGYLVDETENIIAQANDPDKQMRSPDSRLMVVYCDVNGLKAINDHEKMGHAGGDELIKTFGAALKTEFKKYFKRDDDIAIIRKGGDEFVLILQNSTPEYVEKCFENINKSTSFTFGDQCVNVKCAYGYSVYSGQDMDTMLQEADRAQYLNKTETKANGITTTINDISKRGGKSQLPAPAPEV